MEQVKSEFAMANIQELLSVRGASRLPIVLFGGFI